ncbi:hypothetical protein [Marinicrinis sediminis]|uniref:Uncharacterized protein n=1 Tax=Marinicrinis sediminis TaxID=1652465 RepID=A0ABW5RCK7_9BACL
MKKKYFAATLIMSVLPGLGHLYLGLMRRGIQLMISAFASIAFIPVLPMVFPFVLAVIWFYSLFDALTRRSIIQHYLTYVEQHNRSDAERLPSLTTISPYASLDEEVWLIQMARGRRVRDDVLAGGVFILAGGLLATKRLYPPVWEWLTSTDGSSMVLSIALIVFGLYLLLRKRSGLS